MAKPKKPTKMQAFADGLWCDEIHTEFRSMDWEDQMGPDMEGYRCVEVAKCDDCGKWVSSEGQLGENRHNDLDQDTECEGYLNFDGPMMNYFYPCSFRRVGGVDGAAQAIRSTCMVAIELEDGQTGFGMSAGGMDLSWDIAAAYIACGQLPPAHMRLPRMAGYSLTSNRRRIIAALMRSVEVSMNWARNSIEDLKHLRKSLAEQTREDRKRKREQAAQPAAQ